MNRMEPMIAYTVCPFCKVIAVVAVDEVLVTGGSVRRVYHSMPDGRTHIWILDSLTGAHRREASIVGDDSWKGGLVP